jgi:iron complex transport system substrate-binding protein
MKKKLSLVLSLLLISVSLAQIEVVDDLNRKIQFQNPPQRIVSLAPSITETLFSLGLGDRSSA